VVEKVVRKVTGKVTRPARAKGKGKKKSLLLFTLERAAMVLSIQLTNKCQRG
jgi:hypothetical protein